MVICDERMFVCAFVQENKSITNVNLMNNSIGPKGAAAIVEMLKVGLICFML